MQSKQWALLPCPGVLPEGWVSESHPFCKQRSTCWEQFKALNGKVWKFSQHFTAFSSVFELCTLLPWVKCPRSGVWRRSVTRTPHHLYRHRSVLCLCFTFVLYFCTSAEWRICSFLLFLLSRDFQFLFLCWEEHSVMFRQVLSCLSGVQHVAGGQSWGPLASSILCFNLSQLFPSTSSRLFSTFHSNKH